MSKGTQIASRVITIIKTVLVSISAGLLLFSAVFYFLTAFLGTVEFNPGEVLVNGIASLFMLDFHYGFKMIVVGLAIICLVLLIWWVVVLLLKKRYKDLFWVLGVAGIDILALFFAGAYFTSEVELKGEMYNSLYMGILNLEDNLLSALFASISLLFLVGSLLFAGILLFYDVALSSFELKPEVKIVKVVEHHVIREKQPEEPVHIEEDEDYYERMIREMGMFHENEQEQ